MKKELSDCKVEKADLTGKLKMETSELATAKASLYHMNKGSKKLDDISSNQVLDLAKYEISYEHGGCTS